MSNKKTGNAFEAEFCQKLFDAGFWVCNLTQNEAGQPADVIAVKSGTAALIDCKVCEKDVFQFSRIEPNQKTAMKLWQECGNTDACFALKFSDGSIWMIADYMLERLSKTRSSIDNISICKYGTSLERWLKLW